MIWFVHGEHQVFLENRFVHLIAVYVLSSITTVGACPSAYLMLLFADNLIVECKYKWIFYSG